MTEASMGHVWTYNYDQGGADVWRGTPTSEKAERTWVARVPNGVVAQAMCNWLDVYTEKLLPLEINPFTRI